MDLGEYLAKRLSLKSEQVKPVNMEEQYESKTITEKFGLSGERSAEMIRIIEETYTELTSHEEGCPQTDVMKEILNRVEPKDQLEWYFMGYFTCYRMWSEFTNPSDEPERAGL